MVRWDGSTEILTTNQEHPFYVEGIGFVPAGGLEAGQQIATAEGMAVTIELVACNYTVEDYSTYFVGESRLWVHNACDGLSIVVTRGMMRKVLLVGQASKQTFQTLMHQSLGIHQKQSTVSIIVVMRLTEFKNVV